MFKVFSSSIARALLLAALYWMAVKIAVELVYPESMIALFWPPNAIAAAFLIFSARRDWPIYIVAMASAYFAARVPGGQLPLAVYITFGIANIVEVLIIGIITRRYTNIPVTRTDVSRVLFVSALASIPGSLISAGIAGAAVSAAVEDVLYWKASLGWFTGDLSGLLLTLPVLVAWMASGSASSPTLGRERKTESIILLVLLVLLIGISLAFGAYTAGQFRFSLIFPYLVFPLLIWASLRLDDRVVSLAILIVGLSAVTLTLLGQGPFGYGGISAFTEITLMKTGLITIAITTIILVSVVGSRRMAETSLRVSRERLELATKAGNIGVWDLDVINGDLTWDDQMIKMYGLTPETFPGAYEAWSTALHPEDAGRAEASYAAALAGENDFNTEFRISLPGGEVRTIRSAAVVMTNASGEPVRMIGYNQDISLQKEMETKLLEAKTTAEASSAAKSQFLSSMSHELRTPLNAILGFSQLLSLDTENRLVEEQRVAINYIKEGGEHLLELINQVLDLSRIETGKLSLSIDNIDPIPAIKSCDVIAKNMANKRGVIFKDKTDGLSLPLIRADRTRFKQVLLNLLSNAIKYNKDGGSVTLAYELIPGHYARFLVTDTGNGIPNEYLSNVFKPFHRLGAEGSHIEGTGIGLVITKELVHAMRGNLGFETSEGKGSTFWFELPLSKASKGNVVTEIEHPGAMDVEEKDAHSTPNMQKIMYVEDNPANLSLMVKIIGRFPDVELISAHTAEVGLELAELEQPKLILMDINLPGMNGIEALESLKKNPQTSHIPVVAVSAAAMETEIQRGLEAGFKEYLTKPIRIEEVNRVVMSTLGGEVIDSRP